jgi:hypothetical protein
MNPSPENCNLLAEKIEEAEFKLETIELAIEEIGMPAATDLKRRLEALKIEERALRRNFEESIQRGEPDSVRMEKVEKLLRLIEEQEFSVAHDADFLHQAAPSSMWVIAETGVHVIDFLKRGVKRVIGDHRPLGSSVFVNHSHDNLVEFHGLKDEEGKK